MRRGPVSPVPEQVAYKRQVLAGHNGLTCGGMPKVVQAIEFPPVWVLCTGFGAARGRSTSSPSELRGHVPVEKGAQALCDGIWVGKLALP